MADKSTSPPPAYFLSLSLENVRSFGAKQTVSFARPNGRPAQWTIILGDNGVGKTTVLKSLASMMRGKSVDESGRWPLLWRYLNKVWNPLRHNGDVAAEIRAVNTGDKITSDDKIIPETDSDDLRNRSSFSLIIDRDEKDLYRRNKNTLSIGAVIMGAANKKLGTELLCYGYGAGRTIGNSALSELSEIKNTCASLFDDRADLLNPEEWFLNIDYGIRLLAEDKRKQLSEANDRVRQMIKDVLPGVTDLRIDNSGTPQKPQISLQFLLYGTWVRLHDMSLGYQTMVVWLTDFASKLYVRYPESDNPLAEPAIVLIDEIDLHLHPQWQRELLGMLSKIFPNTQFIATAHSPLVVQAAGDVDANVVLLRREGDQTVVVTDVEDVRGWRLDQILTSELFGLETARSPETERKLRRRAELLTKPKRTAAEKKELGTLTKALDAEPVGETPSERDVNAVLQQLRQRLHPTDPHTSAA